MGIVSELENAIINCMGDMPETVYYTQTGQAEISFSTHVFREDKPELTITKSFSAGVEKARLPRDSFIVYIPKSLISSVTINSDTMRVKTNQFDSSYKSKIVRQVKNEHLDGFYVILA